MSVDYQEFLARKSQWHEGSGFEPTIMPDFLFPFQRFLVDWSVRQGRGALFTDCFIPGSLVRSAANEYRAIEALAEGDEIETLHGPAKIERTNAREYNGGTVTLKTNAGFHPITVTPDHKFYVLRKDRCAHASRANTKCSPACNTSCPTATPPHVRYQIELIKASGLTVNDCLLFRQPSERRGRHIEDDDYLTVLGYYLAEGSLSRQKDTVYGVTFAFNKNEINTHVADLEGALKRLGFNPRRNPKKEPNQCLVIAANAMFFARRILSEVGEHSHNKHLPSYFHDLSTRQQLILLRAMFNGDGHINRRPAAERPTHQDRCSEHLKWVTVSPTLAYGVRDALNGMGIRVSSWVEAAKIDKTGQAHRTAYRTLIPRRFMHLFGYPVPVIRRDLRQVEHTEFGQVYTLLPIRQLSTGNYSGKVYNLTSSGHDSYLTEAGTSKNCGTGKTPMELVWADNVRRHTNKPVILATPLGVTFQILTEAEKFGVDDVAISRNGKVAAGITVTNYEQLEKFDPHDFGGMVCDESSAIKCYDGKRKAIVTEFMRTLPYRLLGTATAAPNDYVELGTSSEALGYLGHVDMLTRFFINKQKTADTKGRWMASGRQTRNGAHLHVWDRVQWRFKGHAEDAFWRWVSSWARAGRKPSDFGDEFDDSGFVLPPLETRHHIVEASRPMEGTLFDVPAVGLHEEREAARRTLAERCETAAKLLVDADRAVAWCQLNDEGKLLTKLIDGAVEVSGADSVESKEEKLAAFTRGEIRVMVSKPKIGAWGLNWQHCHRVSYMVSHSYEQYYQAVRRCWRYGQQNPVTVDMITTESGANVLANLERKAVQADRMFDSLTKHMRNALSVQRSETYDQKVEVPVWARS